MTKLTLPSGEYMLIEVPSTAHGFKVCNISAYCWVGYLYDPVHSPSGGSMSDISPLIDLPVAIYTILGIASAITEDVAAGIVNIIFDTPRLYADYLKPHGITYAPITSATASLHSLVCSHGYEPNKCLIIKFD